MSLLKQLINEDPMAGTTVAANIAGTREPIETTKKKRKKRKKTSMRRRAVAISEMETEPSFDEEDVLSKLKDSSKTFDQSNNDTVGFALEDDSGQLVKIFVKAEQASEFEAALASELDDTNQSETEIAEILFNFRKEFDIINVVWPSIPEDEEVNNELGDEGGDPQADDLSSDDSSDPLADDLGGDDLGGDDLGGDDLDMTASDNEDTAASALDKVIGMMTADAEAKKAEAEAKKAEAESKTAGYAAQSAAQKVQAEEEILDMEAYYKKQSDEGKEAKTLAKLAKYKHDLAGDSEEDIDVNMDVDVDAEDIDVDKVLSTESISDRSERNSRRIKNRSDYKKKKHINKRGKREEVRLKKQKEKMTLLQTLHDGQD